ncbi:MAG: helix-turn-helix domain-containing protein [Rhodospirillaceae bacterium]|nr:helix-turn-helix domain-containing protein [Rhodospirillaceae bacterium]
MQIDQPQPNNSPLLYSTGDACALLRCGKTKLFALIKGGHLETVQIGRQRLVRAASLHRLASQGTRAA